MKIIVLGSGSGGNSTYIECNNTKILIDSGISHLQAKKHLSKYNIDLNNLDAIFISHEHIDHISDLTTMLKKTNATLYIKEETFLAAERKLKTSLKIYPHVFINKDCKYSIGDLSIVPIRLSHDTEFCMGYLVRDISTKENISFASITDTGYIPEEYHKVLSFINTLLIESNHDIEMLKNSGRPYFLIQRILSDCGHMSNVDCVKHLKKIVSENTKNVILAHISRECNIPDIALKNVIDAYEGKVPFNLYAASQTESLEINITGEEHD